MTVYELIQKLTEYNADLDVKIERDGNLDIVEVKSERSWQQFTQVEEVIILIE